MRQPVDPRGLAGITKVEYMFYYNDKNALKWCHKYGETNKDYTTALHVIDFVVEDAINVSETLEDIKACTVSIFQALGILLDSK